MTNAQRRFILAVFALSLLAISAFLHISTARRTSLVYDEVIYAPAGAMYWKTGDLRWNAEHPPLQKYISSLPLVLRGASIPSDLNPERVDGWRMGYRFFFQNDLPARSLIFSARLPTIFFSLLLITILGLWVARAAGPEAGLFAAAVFALDPLVISNGALAMNDLFVTFFVFTGLIAMRKWGRNGSMGWALAGGALAGAAVASKFSGFLIVPAFLFLLWEERAALSRRRWLEIAAAVAAGMGVLLLCYRFNADMLLSALRAGESIHSAEGKTGYLLGPIPGASGWFYYPVATLVKTPIPVLILWFASFVFMIRRGAFSANAWLLATVALFWAAALASRNHFGLRYLLPATPFLAAWTGFFYAGVQSNAEKWLCRALLLWLAVAALIAHPHHMAYFNELIGGPKNGYKWLDGSNQDWGQDLPALAALLDRQNPRPALLMGYWGANRPEEWGVEYQDVVSPAIATSFREERVNSPSVEREWLVVSAELMHNPATRAAYAWLKEKTPVAFPGSTLFVFDVSKDLDATLRVAEIYRVMGREGLYLRQMERAGFIGKASNK